MGVVAIKELLEAGVHFGHQTNRWNPKMKRFLFGERNGVYIIDLQQTVERMEQALRACTLWLWLGLRFEGVYGHVEEVYALRSALNDGIERQLKGKRPLAQTRRREKRIAR